MKKHTKDTMEVAAVPYKPKPSARLELGDKFPLPSVTVGEEVTITVRGRITAMNADQYGRSLSFTLTGMKMKAPSRLTDDMKDLRTARMVD